jgi:hypothetical protein
LTYYPQIGLVCLTNINVYLLSNIEFLVQKSLRNLTTEDTETLLGIDENGSIDEVISEVKTKPQVGQILK